MLVNSSIDNYDKLWHKSQITWRNAILDPVGHSLTTLWLQNTSQAII